MRRCLIALFFLLASAGAFADELIARIQNS